MRTVSVSMLVLLLAAGAVAPATADPTGGHCAPPESGFIPWDVDTDPYRADNYADTAGNGNGNGVVCAKPLKLVLDEDGEWFQLYQFLDDRLPR